MKHTISCVVVAACSLTAGQAIAAEPGLYIGAGVGGYTLDIDDTDFDDGATVARVFAGYRFGDHLAIEGDYQKLFEVEDDVLGVDAELDADAWSIALRPILPITDFVDLYGKVGYAWYDLEAQTQILGTSFSADESDSAFTWGGGVDLNFGNLSVRGEVSRIEVDDADLNLVSAGVVFRF